MATLLEERFNGTLADWTVTDEADATASAPSNWLIRTFDDLQQSSNISGTLDAPRSPGTFLTYDLGASWTLYTSTFRISSNDNDIVGFMVYYQDVDNYIQFRSSSQDNQSILWDKVGGVQTELASETFSYNLNKWYDFEVVVTNSTINIKREGIELFGGDISHNGLSSGTFGFFCSGNASGFFDSVFVADTIVEVAGKTSPRIAQVGLMNNKQIGRIF